MAERMLTDYFVFVCRPNEILLTQHTPYAHNYVHLFCMSLMTFAGVVLVDWLFFRIFFFGFWCENLFCYCNILAYESCWICRIGLEQWIFRFYLFSKRINFLNFVDKMSFCWRIKTLCNLTWNRLEANVWLVQCKNDQSMAQISSFISAHVVGLQLFLKENSEKKSTTGQT